MYLYSSFSFNKNNSLKSVWLKCDSNYFSKFNSVSQALAIGKIRLVKYSWYSSFSFNKNNSLKFVWLKRDCNYFPKFNSVFWALAIGKIRLVKYFWYSSFSFNKNNSLKFVWLKRDCNYFPKFNSVFWALAIGKICLVKYSWYICLFILWGSYCKIQLTCKPVCMYLCSSFSFNVNSSIEFVWLKYDCN